MVEEEKEEKGENSVVEKEEEEEGEDSVVEEVEKKEEEEGCSRRRSISISKQYCCFVIQEYTSYCFILS